MKKTLEQKRADRKAREESAKRIAIAKQQTLEIVKSGTCPQCKSGLKRNSALTGWWQCEQFGAEQFRKNPAKPACSWQGFVD